MSEKYVRFVGDPTGYRVERLVDEPPPWDVTKVWVKARVGRTDREVWIDLSQAYLIEDAF